MTMTMIDDDEPVQVLPGTLVATRLATRSSLVATENSSSRLASNSTS